MVISQGKPVADAVRAIGVTEVTYTGGARIWRAEDGSMICGRVTPGTGPLSNSSLRSKATFQSKKVTPYATSPRL